MIVQHATCAHTYMVCTWCNQASKTQEAQSRVRFTKPTSLAKQQAMLQHASSCLQPEILARLWCMFLCLVFYLLCLCEPSSYMHIKIQGIEMNYQAKLEAREARNYLAIRVATHQPASMVPIVSPPLPGSPCGHHTLLRDCVIVLVLFQEIHTINWIQPGSACFRQSDRANASFNVPVYKYRSSRRYKT
jgi:hypothetical protein